MKNRKTREGSMTRYKRPMPIYCMVDQDGFPWVGRTASRTYDGCAGRVREWLERDKRLPGERIFKYVAVVPGRRRAKVRPGRTK